MKSKPHYFNPQLPISFPWDSSDLSLLRYRNREKWNCLCAQSKVTAFSSSKTSTPALGPNTFLFYLNRRCIPAGRAATSRSWRFTPLFVMYRLKLTGTLSLVPHTPPWSTTWITPIPLILSFHLCLGLHSILLPSGLTIDIPLVYKFCPKP
jgi:hypothetical protein